MTDHHRNLSNFQNKKNAIDLLFLLCERDRLSEHQKQVIDALVFYVQLANYLNYVYLYKPRILELNWITPH